MRLLVPAVVLAATAATALAAPAVSSQPARYSVQVLIFRYTGPDAAQGEIWPPTVAAPATAKAVYPPAVATGKPYAALATPAAAMTAAANRIAGAAGYTLVLQLGWRQPQTPPTQAVAVSVAPPLASAPDATTAGPAAVDVDGTVTVVTANRKPNVALDLRLCEPPPPNLELQLPAPAGTVPGVLAATLAAPAAFTSQAPVPTAARQCFALEQRRFVTAGRLEYFDTPAFGVLVLVDEIKPPE